MPEPQGVTQPSDILFDLEGAAKRAAWVERLASEAPLRGPTRDLDPRPRRAGEAAPPPHPADAGDQFVARRPPELRARYRTVLCLEAAFRADLDFGFLIGSACQVLETELAHLLLTPARAIGGPLVKTLAAGGKAKQAEILEGWVEERFGATIGTASLVLLALRYGLAAGDAACRAFVGGSFRPGYAALASAKHLGGTVDRIREQFRNPACHGLRTFGPGDYEQFARLAVGRGRFADWAALGALPDEPPGSAALLHHHLAESLQLPDAPAPAEATPLERLLALARPRESALSIRLEPQFAAAPPLRDLQVGPPRLPRPFRLGDPVRFAFRASAECAVALVDVGTTGKVAVALPNCWQPQARARAGEVCWLPDPAAGNFEFTLSGQGGRERVVALAWRGRPPVPLAPAGDAAFRTLGEADLAGLCDAVERLPPGEWAACLCEFEIVPGPGA